MGKIKVRLAPSPTGPLHIGTARTALFNYLFSRQNNGEFILRFEDTDELRSTKVFEKNIIQNLKWLGLNWDAEPSYQMQRLGVYQKYADKLIKKGYAQEINGAIIFKAKKALDDLKIDYIEKKKIYKKSNKNNMEDQNSKAYLVKNITKDLIHGEISGLISDAVLLRKNGLPTFHLAVVIDDEEMNITHIIRGDDHLPNTPLHVLLQKSFGFKTPLYAHIPLILNPDRSKMSKRQGTVDISKYRDQGYLPQAIVNFLALLGWAPNNNQQLLSLENLIKEFDIKKVQKSASIFDHKKLDYLNGYYVRKLGVGQLDEMLRENYYPSTDLNTLKLTQALQSRMVKLSQASEMSEFFFDEPKINKKILVFKKSNINRTNNGLAKGYETLKNAPESAWSNIDELNNILQHVVKENDNLENGDVFWPVRVALSGAEQSPSPGELLEILGREKSLARIKEAIEKIPNS